VTGRPRRSIDDLLEEARAGLLRLEPAEARAAADKGAVLVDIRSDTQRARDGTIPGAIHHARNVLEWRLDPDSDATDPALSADLDRQLILVCHEGYQSSLAASTAQELGFANATDMIGGFQAWRAAGMPVDE
jgi:rhodanese-related sulfurtransferase